MGKQSKEAKKQGQSTGPVTPPTDPTNEEFVIFISTDERPQWLPVSIVTGGAQANTMLKASKGKIGDGVMGSTLKNNIGRTLYEQEGKLLEDLRGPKGPSGYEEVESITFGFKVRDKSVPEDWWKPEDVVEVPPKNEIPEGAVDTVKKGWSSFADRITGKNKKQGKEEEQLDDIIAGAR